MSKAKVLTCIAPEAWLQRNPSLSRSSHLDFSKCYRRSAMYGKTLACCTRTVYPPRFFADGIASVGQCVPLALVRSYVCVKQRF
jgi:hypothetical protein